MTHKVYINYHEVQHYLEQIVTPIKEEKIKAWFNKKLPNHLMTTYPSVSELDVAFVDSYFMNQEVPVVIRKAVENKEKIYHFKSSKSFKSKIPQIIDYLKHLESKSINIAGMPFSVAYEQSDKWHESFSKPAKRKVLSVNMEGLKLIKHFDNDCFLEELISKEQFDYESKMMAHCVQSYYGRNYSRILTYRTSENKPLLTIEVVDKTKGFFNIVQAKGFANKGFIPEEHVKNVLNYFHSLGLRVNYDDCLIFGHLIDDKPLIIMPENSTFTRNRYETEIEIKCCVGIPKGSTFEGDLRLSAAQLPILQDITVNGDLMIDNSLIVAIMDSVKVTGSIYIYRSLTSIIAPELQSKIRRN